MVIMKPNVRLDSKPTITIYCKEWCHYLRKVVNLLQEHQMSFNYIDLNYDPEAAQKLLSELGNPLILPIVVINGTCYEKPPFSKLIEVLVKNQRREILDRNQYGIS